MRNSTDSTENGYSILTFLVLLALPLLARLMRLRLPTEHKVANSDEKRKYPVE